MRAFWAYYILSAERDRQTQILSVFLKMEAFCRHYIL